jgi:hypothetical protein
MQLNRTMRIAGITVSGAALGLLPAAGVASAHDADSSNPSLHGRVESVGSGEFVVKTFHGGTVTVDTTGTTAYSELGNSAPLPGVVDGEWVAISLDPLAQAPTATSVTVFPESVGGKVTGVSGSNVTLASRQGARTVLLTPSTTFVQKDAAPTGVSVGELVVAAGLPDPSTPTTLDAQRVFIVTPHTAPNPPQPQPTVTSSTAPFGADHHQPGPQDKPFEPSGGNAPAFHQPQPGAPAFGQGGSPGSGRFNGGPDASQHGSPSDGGHDSSHDGSSGGSDGGHSGGGFNH